MPTINFRTLATAEEHNAIEQDFRSMIAALEGALDADFTVTTGLAPDPELVATWVELHGGSESDDLSDLSEDDPDAQPTGGELTVTVRDYTMGSISGLTMNFAELLTTREKDPAEPLLRQVKDDAGTPRVPWHVEVRP
ncbi:hypothetical protein GC425_05840 [Corynebacterium sp. zg254]|uniref:Uncharacterized protein n=1 Tax=Corynebacterium zhongnanshanii TaxID=2768834 RepID=A0ABQ6VGL1_9CORY|nr:MULTISPECIES: hypothetical protein [Corynebacterium]KAB3520769.1 hypothetical protein F8377_05860 [Corynebacterium zhongnanshanii]MCR5914386.1 hypothetical protein [Corynebacterium sp. zg254]